MCLSRTSNDFLSPQNLCISHPSLQGVLTCPPFISARWDTAWLTWHSCSELWNYLWAAEVTQSRSCTKPWGPWSRWWLEQLAAGTACGSCNPGALQSGNTSGKKCPGCVSAMGLSVPPPLRGLGRRRAVGGWKKESWNHLDFSLFGPYDVTDVSASGEWNEVDLEWW